MSRGIWGKSPLAARMRGGCATGSAASAIQSRSGARGQRPGQSCGGCCATVTGMHVPPDRMTVAQWLDHWLELGCPGRRQGKPRPHTVERYRQLIAHAIPVLGGHRLQKLTGADLDGFYASLAGKIAPGTQHQAHVILRAALAAAVRAGALAASPMERTLNAPSSGESNHGIALDEDDMRRLIEGFRGSPLALFVSLAAYTGMRRNEALGLRWGDFDEAGKTPKVERAVRTRPRPGSARPPKTRRGLRTVAIDDNLVGLLGDRP